MDMRIAGGVKRRRLAQVAPNEASTWHYGGFCGGFQVSNFFVYFLLVSSIFIYIVFMLTYLVLFDDNPHIMYSIFKKLDALTWWFCSLNRSTQSLGDTRCLACPSFPLERH